MNCPFRMAARNRRPRGSPRPKKMKTVSGKVSRGGSHDTNGRRPYLNKIALRTKKVNPCELKKAQGQTSTPRTYDTNRVEFSLELWGELSREKYLLGIRYTKYPILLLDPFTARDYDQDIRPSPLRYFGVSCIMAGTWSPKEKLPGLRNGEARFGLLRGEILILFVRERRMSTSYAIAVIPGDGTGPEVVHEGQKVLSAAAELHNFTLNFENFDLGGERYLKTGEVLPDSVVEDLKKADAIYLGAIGHPEVAPGILEKGILLRLRCELDQYVNLRPVKLYPGVPTPLRDKGPQQIDFLVVRENTEGFYVGAGGFLKKGTPDEVAIQESINTRKGVERLLRYSFEAARARGKEKKLTLCGKTNVLTYAWDLWMRTFSQLAEEYPDVTTDYAHVDAICMWMLKNPEWFDVIATDNMFGDIITDLGAMLQGGMGIAAGGNINPQGVSMFEPIGGSAPKYSGKYVINPLACILAGALMLQIVGEDRAAQAVENAVEKVISKDLKSLEAGRMGHSTSEIGDLVSAYLT